MLRTSLRSVRALGSRPVAAAAGRQWQAAVVRPMVLGQRYYADDKKSVPDAAKPAVLPASETITSPATAPPPTPETVPPASISPDQVPLTPPPPPASASDLAKSVPPPKKKKGFFRRLRNYVLTLTLLGALAFGGGVWYSRINDNFHDFFTEYVPYGEQAVLYLEEMDFRKRFPNAPGRIGTRQRETGEQVKIPAQSGASWRVADAGEAAGRQSSAVPKAVAAAREVINPKKEPETVVEAKKETAELPKTEGKIEASKKKRAKKAADKAEEKVAPVVPAPDAAAAVPAFKAPEVDEPSKWPPASPIDPLAVNGAREPVVQDLVRMLNDIITVVNADGAAEKYGQTLGKAKNELNKVANKLDAIKKAAEEGAAKQVKTRVDAFDKAANELISRVEGAMSIQEVEWRKEFEAEMKRLKESYDDKVNVILQREQQIHEERVNNKLMEQALELQRQFAQDIKGHVEQEREGRLGKLKELSSAVADLEKLTSGWNELIDRNLKTQQLHVAVKAVQASLADSQSPRPFIKELVALKEIAAGDEVVDAAIASINPASYQRGVSGKADLIDRFRRVATEVRKASLLPDEAGVASHASSYVLSKVLFKKQGLAAGDDVESILTRTQTYLEEGDLDNAAREMNGLTGWAKTLSKDWLGEVRKVLEVQQALDVIQTEARLQSLRVD